MDDEYLTPRKRLGRSSFRVGLAGLIGLVVLSAGAGFLGGMAGANRGGSQSASVQRQTVLNEEQLVNGIAEDVGPSVVSVDVTTRAQPRGGTLFEQYFGGNTPQRPQESAGTGIIISGDGVVVTNRHVVPEGSDEVSVTMSDGTKLDNVEVIGRAADNSGIDIAFLKIKDAKGKELKPAKLGDSSKMQVGDRVVAIGNALGQFQNTVTSGILSGYGRSVQAGDGTPSGGGDIENLQDLFQTDAAINQGNSGGPLVNASGEVIGINTAVAGGNAQNIGFAIPLNDVRGLVDTVLRTGKFQQPYLGVRYITLTDDVAKELDLKVTRGAYVMTAEDAGGQASIITGGPAAKAGIKEKDIIQAVNGTNVDNEHSLSSLLARQSVGDTVELKVLRGDDTQTIRVKLEAVPASANE